MNFKRSTNKELAQINKEDIIKVIQDSDWPYKATQNKLCIPIINRIYKKMMHGIKFDNIKTCETLIIDGHHRFICSILSKTKLQEAKSAKTNATIEYTWKEVEFVEEEWDTEDKIKRLNENDASFNNMTIEQLNELLK